MLYTSFIHHDAALVGSQESFTTPDITVYRTCFIHHDSGHRRSGAGTWVLSLLGPVALLPVTFVVLDQRKEVRGRGTATSALEEEPSD